MSDTEAVLQIARSYLRNIKRSGSENIMATCPFHQMVEYVSTTFSMSLTKGVYFCFSCKARGGLRQFLQEMGMTRDAISQNYGVIVDHVQQHRDPEFDVLRPGVVSSDPLPEALLGLFDRTPKGLLDDGFPEELLIKQEIGFDEDHFRITYPIRDLKGNLVGVSGRTVIDAAERYKVYRSEYSVWGLPARDTKKELYLWNAHNIYPIAHFQRQPTIIVVEGFKACLRMLQYGHENTVALMGSYLTRPQRWILETMGARVLLMLDNNLAGRRGTSYAAEQLCKGLDVFIVQYDAEQPDALDQQGASMAIDNATNYTLWMIEQKANEQNDLR